jgi:hypothetical protein
VGRNLGRSEIDNSLLMILPAYEYLHKYIGLIFKLNTCTQLQVRFSLLKYTAVLLVYTDDLLPP